MLDRTGNVSLSHVVRRHHYDRGKAQAREGRHELETKSIPAAFKRGSDVLEQ